METAEYARLAEYEDWYWWYRAQRRALVEAVGRLRLPPGARVLDAGCGSGRNLRTLAEDFPVLAFGFDRSDEAARLWNGDTDVRRGLASINELPYDDEQFEVVVSADVLCCEEVRVEAAMAEMVRVLRPNGHLVLLVPAYQWLLSSHDAAVHCVRRFSRGQLRQLLTGSGLCVERIRFLFGLFFPVIAMTRVTRKSAGDAPRSDLRPLPRWLNEGLYAAACAEQSLGRRLPWPFGTTLLAVARKEAG